MTSELGARLQRRAVNALHTGARLQHRAVNALHTRLRGLDLRDMFGTILGIAGTAIAVTQLTSLARPAEIALIIIETALITSIFVILPPKEERLQRVRKNTRKSEKVALVSVAAIAVLLWIGAGHFFPMSNTAPMRTFDPFTLDGNIQPYFHVKPVAGHCWELSPLDRRPDAWRCISGNQVYDPCFDDGSDFVACAANPWTSEITRINLTSPLNFRLIKPQAANSEAPFWAMTLTVGVECVILPGASTVIDLHRVNYTCQDGYVVSTVDPSSATAQVLSPGTSTFGAVGILVAWNLGALTFSAVLPCRHDQRGVRPGAARQRSVCVPPKPGRQWKTPITQI
jgi:hypothetical protein